MRFIHTGDWHLGNQMHDIDRREEAYSFLNWLSKIIKDKKIDTLIVSGDIFDTVNPSVEARRLYYSFLASLLDSSCKNIVIIAGNHDSPPLLEAAKEILELLNVRVIPSISNLKIQDMVFELFDSENKVIGIMAALPFVRETELRSFYEDNNEGKKLKDEELYSSSYSFLYKKLLESCQKLKKDRNIPLIASGHLYASDLEGRLAGAKSNQKSDDGVKVLDVLGNLGAVPASVFPPDFDYIALGHIHYSTMVGKNPKIRYSGSPFVMGFDEAEIPHCVLDVNLSENKSKDGELFSSSDLSVEKIRVPDFCLYRRISGTLAQIKSKIDELTQKEVKEDKKVYLEVCYKKEFGVNAQEYLNDSIAALPENYSVVSWKVAAWENVFTGDNSQFEGVEIKNLDDKEIFTELILRKSGLEADSPEGKAVLEKFLPYFLQMGAEV